MEVMQLPASLPQPIYSANQVLQHEMKAAQSAGITLFELMQRAGASAYNELASLSHNKMSVLVVAGKGNNGGDGFVVARHCLAHGFEVSVLVLCEEGVVSGEAKLALEQFQSQQGECNFISDLAVASQYIADAEADIIVDAIFGIGFRGKLSEPWQQVISEINQHCGQVLSVDIPSGLCATTGAVDTIAVAADITVTFIVIKQGLVTGKAANVVGSLRLATLDVQSEFVQLLPTNAFAQGRKGLPNIQPRRPTIHKGSIGLVLSMGGNIGMPGAIRMASEAALRAGAALVAVACQEANQAIVSQGRPELMLAPSEPERLKGSNFIQKAKVLLIGPGLGQDTWAQQLVKVASEQEVSLVVDADALALVKQLKLYRQDWVLTPHPGEAAYLLGTDIATIEADRYKAARTLAVRYGGICVLKGSGTIISDGEQVIVNTTGNSGMASGGMGDVLSGIIAALILQTGSLMDATRLAVSIHGQAAEAITQQHGMRGLLASDLYEPIRQLVNLY
ncbi:NAD(P)H-hydrate dehydratase [Thalassotalea euphylliae]|uniref:NAD(P)H-hydrate dehydratase n=1 Tax=Thalassotalea euphylliae TaxID=1655234 RepID=UPI0036376C41